MNIQTKEVTRKKNQRLRKWIDRILNAPLEIGDEVFEFDFEICITEWTDNTVTIDGLVYEILNGYHGYGKLYDSIHEKFMAWARMITGDIDAYYEFLTYFEIMPVSYK